jgi:hypothetical protein
MLSSMTSAIDYLQNVTMSRVQIEATEADRCQSQNYFSLISLDAPIYNRDSYMQELCV